MNIKKWIAHNTEDIRYSVVLNLMKAATPSLYKTLSMVENSWSPRPMINFVSACFDGKPIVGAEIGVFRGENAKSILQTLNVQKLYLIDPYIPYEDAKTSIKLPDALHYATKNLARFKNRIEWIRKTSEDALQQFSNGFFDFVYVDGNHAYDYVKKDLQGYWEKVKKGGILGGHDFWGPCSGIVKAVMEFSKKMNKSVFGKHIDYWFIKD